MTEKTNKIQKAEKSQKIRARKPIERQKEKLKKLASIKPTEPKFTLDEKKDKEKETRWHKKRTIDYRKRVTTFQRAKNEYTRPVSITAQKMYFGDWTIHKTADKEQLRAKRHSK